MNHLKRLVMSAALVVAWFALVPTSSSLAQDYSKLGSLLNHEFASSFGFSVLVASDERVLFHSSYGYIDDSQTLRVNDETLFNIASVTKAITALEVLRLVEQGRIGLHDSIPAYLDNVPADKQAVTIAELLSHTAGFGQNYAGEGIENVGAALDSLLKEKLRFEPGSSFGYSNENFALLAIIIERVTGKQYEDVVRSEILKPLGMTNTFFWDDVDSIANVAGRHVQESEGPTPRDWGFIGSAGIYSSPTDLYRFWKGVKEHTLLPDDFTALLFKPNYRTSSGIDIGFGWYVTDSSAWGCREIWTRGTESWGPNAVIRWFPVKNTVIIVCTNSGELGDKNETGNRIVSRFIADYLWK